VPKVSKAFANFTAGEVTPKLYGRTDISKYDNGAETVENFLVQPHGGLLRRPGTRFVAEVKSSDDAVRLVPFEYNVEQAYVLEFGPLYFRIYKDGGQVTSGGNAVEVTTVYPAVDLDGLKFAQAADTMYVVSPNHPIYKITRTSHTAWTITEVVTSRGPMLDENATTTTLTPDSRDGTVQLTASASTFASTDVGRLVKVFEGYVRIATFTSATVVSGAAQELEDGRSEILPSYVADTISFHEGDPDSTALEHNDRIEDSAAAFIDEGFENGQTIIISGSTSNNSTAGFLIVDVTDSVLTLAPGADLTTETADTGHTIQGKLEATDKWSLGAFSDTTGYPRAVAFYEQRLVFAGTDNQPQTLFFSQGGDFENFEGGTEADDGMVYTIGSNQVNVIRFLASTRNLVCGTSGGEFAVRAGGTDEAITPTNIQIKQQTAHGAADIQPVQAGNAILFVQRAKRKVLELQYNFDADGYIAPDVALISEHITANGLDELAFQQEPDSILWSVRGDGQIACMTYKREEKVIGWTRQIVGGSFDGGSAVVENIATIPGDLDEDQIWMVTKRDLDAAASCTLTVTDYANIATDTTITLTSDDGTTATFTCQGAGTGSPDANKFFHNQDNDTTADNIYTCINAHADYTVANPAANVITITRAAAGNSNLVTTTGDPVRLAITNFSGGRAAKRYIEYVKDFDFGTNVSDAVFVDSSLTYTGAATTLSGSIAADATTITLVDSSGLASSGAVKIGNEIITYTGNTSNQLTGCTRAVVAAAAAHDNGAAVTQAALTLSGLTHLEGETVSILGDGSVHPDKTVSSGAVTLERYVTKAHAGLAYNSTLRTLRVDAGSRIGTSQGKIKRIHELTVRLRRSVGLKVGRNADNLDVVPFRSSATAMDSPIALFTGDKEIELGGNYDTDGQLTIRQDQPLPMNILAVYATLSTFDQ
jgi:hypothetical protein